MGVDEIFGLYLGNLVVDWLKFVCCDWYGVFRGVYFVDWLWCDLSGCWYLDGFDYWGLVCFGLGLLIIGGLRSFGVIVFDWLGGGGICGFGWWLGFVGFGL